MKIYLFSDAIIQGWSNNEASPLIINASLVGEIDTESPAVYRFVPSVTSGEVLVLNSASGATAVETYAEKLAFNVAKINGAPTTQRAFAVEFNGLSFVKEVGGKAIIYANGKTYEATESIADLISAIEAFEVPGSDLDAPEEAAVQALIDAATGDLGGDTVQVWTLSQINTAVNASVNVHNEVINSSPAGEIGPALTIAHNFGIADPQLYYCLRVSCFFAFDMSPAGVISTTAHTENSFDVHVTGLTPSSVYFFVVERLS